MVVLCDLLFVNIWLNLLIRVVGEVLISFLEY